MYILDDRDVSVVAIIIIIEITCFSYYYYLLLVTLSGCLPFGVQSRYVATAKFRRVDRVLCWDTCASNMKR